jgi:putative ABC transport system permease protein
LIRGVRHQSTWVYPKLRILEGHFPRSGEVMVGVLAHQKLGMRPDQLTIGKELRFNDQSFTVSGIFVANGTVMEAEVWMPLQDLMTATQRDNLSCVVVRMLEVNGFSVSDAVIDVIPFDIDRNRPSTFTISVTACKHQRR